MPNLSDLNRIYGLESKIKVDSKQIVRKKVLPSKEISNDPLPSKPKRKIKTDRDLNKPQLTERIVEIMRSEENSIPIEIFRGFDLFFRVIKERGL